MYDCGVGSRWIGYAACSHVSRWAWGQRGLATRCHGVTIKSTAFWPDWGRDPNLVAYQFLDFSIARILVNASVTRRVLLRENRGSREAAYLTRHKLKPGSQRNARFARVSAFRCKFVCSIPRRKREATVVQSRGSFQAHTRL